ncbi:hypothetical protein SteCoe_24894 [Stentor coeruleus]|uniref:Uncharacterized protein n=1 Tax=Stentor coeruleus TaxID=5963 RepID=A0A1R2BGW3_9CILI|nr:hypothetical protein SteCoe_24894 [Stentor coeruleus]
MVEGNRNTARFSPVNIENQVVVEAPQVFTPRSTNTEGVFSEGFQFSFNDISREENKKSCDPSPSPIQEFSSKSMPITKELSSLQTQIQAINSKIYQNLTILKEKQAKNQELKYMLLKHELKSTVPTDTSFTETKCTCNQYCRLL